MLCRSLRRGDIARGFDFSRYLLTPFFEPSKWNWQQLLAAYHEWVHFYQCHASTDGYL
jgi:hypothetical protein